MSDRSDLPPLDLSAPLDRCRETIIADWVDANRHMNVAYYMVVFDEATEVFLRQRRIRSTLARMIRLNTSAAASKMIHHYITSRSVQVATDTATGDGR